MILIIFKDYFCELCREICRSAKAENLHLKDLTTVQTQGL